MVEMEQQKNQAVTMDMKTAEKKDRKGRELSRMAEDDSECHRAD